MHIVCLNRTIIESIISKIKYMAKLKMTKKVEPKIKKKESKLKRNNTIDKKKLIKLMESKTSVDKIPGLNIEPSLCSKTWNLKLVSWNVNGIRASIKNDCLKYLIEENADIVGIQETKCSKIDMPIEAKNLMGYTSFMSSAEKNGYAGTGMYTNIQPINVSYGIGKKEHDNEGRVITAEYESFYFVTAYVPNSGRGLVRLEYRKNSWDIDFIDYLKNLDKTKPIIVCGDLNVSHKEIDLANPKGNLKTAGFTKEERLGFDNLLESVGLVDTFRHFYPDRKDAYTFWSYMGGSRAKNIGWRLDYFLLSKRLLSNVCDQQLRTNILGSDHCPIVLYLNM